MAFARKENMDGIEWYNSLSERERAEWHYVAGSERPKDAWEAFKLWPNPIRNKLGWPIPNSHFENEPGSPPSKEMLEWIEKVRVRHGSDKYFSGDWVGGY